VNQTATVEFAAAPLTRRAWLRSAVGSWQLLLVMARHDFRARYRSTFLGVGWSIALPLVQALVLAVVFKRVVRIGNLDHFSVYVLAGVTVWSYFSQSLGGGSTAVVDNSPVASKVYFPRVLLPLLMPTINLPGFVLALGLGVVMTPVLGAPLQWTMLALPLVAALAWLLVSVLCAALAVLHVYNRDVRFLVGASLLVWMYATPIVYPLSATHDLTSYLLVNPATGLVQMAHWAFLGQADHLLGSLAWTFVWIAVLMVVVLESYRRYERLVCDRL
jgi:lipopolysaccharide transport system permease protein